MNEEPLGRYEIKFILDECSYTEALRWIYCETTAKPAFSARRVHSLYFDDDEFQSVTDNLSGIADRYKVRFRWYQDKDETSGIYGPVLETKIREGRLGFKHQVDVPEVEDKIERFNLREFTSFLKTQMVNTDLGCEMFSKHLNPVLNVSYLRRYFEDHNGIRYTLDENIKFSQAKPDCKLKDHQWVNYPHRIMELKFHPNQKDTVSRSFRKLALVPKRNSKYLTGSAIFDQATYV